MEAGEREIKAGEEAVTGGEKEVKDGMAEEGNSVASGETLKTAEAAVDAAENEAAVEAGLNPDAAEADRQKIKAEIAAVEGQENALKVEATEPQPQPAVAAVAKPAEPVVDPVAHDNKAGWEPPYGSTLYPTADPTPTPTFTPSYFPTEGTTVSTTEFHIQPTLPVKPAVPTYVVHLPSANANE